MPTPTDEIKEFWALVDRNGPMCTALGTRCWEWQGRRLNAGYGQVRLSGKTLLTHRIAWEIEVGLIPDGLQVLHHCDNPPCCRPDHLWTGTQLENMRDALRKGRLRNGNKGRTHCVRGHEFTPENTYVVPCGKRQCRACVRVTSGRWRKANRTYRYGEKDRARAARYYQRHREKILDRQREYDRQNSVALLARRRARRAKRAA